MSISNNITNTTDLPLDERICFMSDPPPIKILRIIPYAMIMPISIFGNILVIYIVYQDLSLHKTVNYFIVNMGISDLLITTVYMPRVLTILIWGYRWLIEGHFGYALCKSVSFLYETAVIVSILTIVAISFDRLFAVIWPLKSIITKRICKVMIVVIWCVALTSRLPIALAIKLYMEENGHHFCFVFLDDIFSPGTDMVYYKVTLAIFYATPLTVITLAYTGILSTLYRRKIPSSFVDINQSTRIEQLNRQVLRMVLVVVGSFVFCWLLYFIVMVFRIHNMTIPCDVFYLRMFLAHSNCAINPCLYIILSENYRKGFKKVIRGLRCWCHCGRVKKNEGSSLGLDNPYMMELTVSNGSVSHLAYTLDINRDRNTQV